MDGGDCPGKDMTENLPKRLLHLLRRILHIDAAGRILPGQKVFDQPQSHIVSQALQVLVHIVYILKVAQHLRDQSAVREG